MALAAVLAGAPIGLVPTASLAAGKQAKAAADATRDPDDAKLRSGITLVEARNYARALVELEKAYTTAKRPRALYWMARAKEESNHHADALRLYEQYLREESPEAGARDAVEVMGRVQMLSLQLGFVIVRAPAGALIAIDGAPIGKAPLAGPVYVEPGAHTITADGDEQTFELSPEGHTEIQLTARERKKDVVIDAPPVELDAPPTAPASPNVEEKPRSSKALTVGGFAAAGALAATSVYFTVKALGTASDFSRRKGELGASQPELEDLQGRTRLQAGVALGTGVAAIAAAAVTILVFRKPGQTEARVGFNGSGFDLSGRF